MRTGRSRVLLGASLAALVTSSAIFAQSDPRIGRWKMNAKKSSASSDAPESDLRTYEATPDGTKFTWAVVDAKGTAHSAAYTAKLDGKDYPITGDPDLDTVALRLRDANTVELTVKKAGKVVEDATAEVSKDGKTMTQRSKDGKTVLVFDKQP